MPRLRHARDETPAGAPPSRWVGPALQRTMRHQPTIRRQQQTRGFLHSRARQWACLLLVLPWLVAVPAGAEPLPVVRIGVLKFGTVNWGLDVTRDAEPLFAAPPLLNEILKRADIPAAINFWQYNARLPEPDYFELVRVEDMLPALGVPPQTPLLGWVFSEAWAAKYPGVV